jgi:hypothetical protein
MDTAIPIEILFILYEYLLGLFQHPDLIEKLSMFGRDVFVAPAAYLGVVIDGWRGWLDSDGLALEVDL